MAKKPKQDRRGAPKGRTVVPHAGKNGHLGGGGSIGNPPHERDPQIAAKVKLCRALGMAVETMAEVTGVAKDTILRHYRHEYDNGLTEANMKVGAAIFNTALGEEITCVTCRGEKLVAARMCQDCRGKGRVWIREPSPTAQIWWSKNNMGWSDQQRIEHTGAGGGPIMLEQVSSADTVRSRLDEIAKRLAPPKQ